MTTADAKEYVPPTRRANNSGGGPRRASTLELQNKVLDHLAQGLTIRAAMAKVDRAEATYEQWRIRYPDFANRVDRLRARMRGKAEAPKQMDFGAWRQEYMHMETFPHQWQWVDVLEGRVPRDLHDAMIYLPGRAGRVIINTPPFHAKTATISIDYVVYRICYNPNVRVIIVSESRDMARKMLTAIKERLTHPKYEEMQRDFGPPGGYKVGAASWTQDLIYVGGRDPDEKDPTVEVLGVGSQIYGARADLIILDDTVTLKTAYTTGQRDKIIRWLDQEVSSRLDPKGKLLMVGTRVSPNDVYSSILKRDADRANSARTWTYFAQPAVLEYAEDPEEWNVLWPFMWPGVALHARRDEIDLSTWNLVYQQQQVAEDAVFPEQAVMGCCYLGNTGVLDGDHPRPGGMSGLYVVAGLDPASSGYTAIVVLAVDKRTRIRYLLDVINHRGCTPQQLRDHVRRVQDRYRPQEWRIEKNGLQTMISQDREIRQYIMARGGKVVEHTTGQNKWDSDYGVASLAPMFLGAMEVPPKPLILIPNNHTHKGVKALLDQLITWEPQTKGKTDTVMALWFADLACRKVIETASVHNHMQNKWLDRRGRAQQRVVNIDEYLLEREMGMVYA